MFAPFFFGIAILFAILAIGYRSRLQQAGRQIAYLYGRLFEAERKTEEYKEQARQGIELAMRAVKEARQGVEFPVVREPAVSYVPQVVAFCSACNVSVRHPPEAYPVKCPACQNLIDPILDNPPEL